jgi:acyl-homoserine lactone acylase PvdQ
MKFLIKIAFFLVALITGSQYFLPRFTDQKVDLEGFEGRIEILAEVETGIPHIYADSRTDAFRGLGYVTARERLW